MDFIDRLTEILENGLEVHAELVGYVFQLHVILKAKPKDCEVRFLKMVLGIVANGINSFHPLFNVLPIRINIHRIEFAELVGYGLLPDAVNTAITYGCHQVGSHFVICRKNVALHESHEDILNDVFSFGIVVHERSGQANHLAVVQAKESVKYRLVNHILSFSIL